ncbi:MAG: hypothetical protein WAT39_03300 [Planctomycetota bacterium]
MSVHEQHAPGEQHEAVPLDPENDINARSATIWFVGGAIVVFFSLWVMVPIFLRVLEVERIKKVDSAPTTELNDVKDAEFDFLNGQNPKNRKIDEVLAQLRKK